MQGSDGGGGGGSRSSWLCLHPPHRRTCFRGDARRFSLGLFLTHGHPHRCHLGPKFPDGCGQEQPLETCTCIHSRYTHGVWAGSECRRGWGNSIVVVVVLMHCHYCIVGHMRMRVRARARRSTGWWWWYCCMRAALLPCCQTHRDGGDDDDVIFVVAVVLLDVQGWERERMRRRKDNGDDDNDIVMWRQQGCCHCCVVRCMRTRARAGQGAQG